MHTFYNTKFSLRKPPCLIYTRKYFFKFNVPFFFTHSPSLIARFRLALADDLRNAHNIMLANHN